MANTEIILLRTHIVDERVLTYSDRLSRETKSEVIFVVDERNGTKAVPSNYRKISIIDAAITRLDIFCPKDFTWRCGDYGFYLAREYLGDAEFVWQLEYDTELKFSNLDTFFSYFHQFNNVDFLAPYFKVSGPAWSWYRRMKPFTSQVHACLFPAVRMSVALIDFLLAARRRLSSELNWQDNWHDFPNDESFCASMAVEGGFSCKDINAIWPETYTPVSFPIDGIPIPVDFIYNSDTNGRLFHPVYSPDLFRQKVTDYIKRIENLGSLNTLEMYLSFTDPSDEKINQIKALIPGIKKQLIASSSICELEASSYSLEIKSFTCVEAEFRFCINDPAEYIQSHHTKGRFYEELELFTLRELAANAGTFLDVGACIGNHSIFALRFLKCAVICVEPNILAIPLLRHNLAVNDGSNEPAFQVMSLALSDKSETIWMCGKHENLGVVDVSYSAKEGWNRIECMTGDELFHDSKVDIIKIDAGLMAVKVLNGMTRLISRCKPTIMVCIYAPIEDEFRKWISESIYKTVWQYERYKGQKNYILTCSRAV